MHNASRSILSENLFAPYTYMYYIYVIYNKKKDLKHQSTTGFLFEYHLVIELLSSDS